MRRRQLAIAIAVLLMASGLSGAPGAHSVRRGDPSKERERVRAEEAALAAKLDVQKASLGRIDAALQALDSDLSTQRALLAQANQELADARAEVHRDTEAVRRTQAHLADLVAAMRERAIASYVSPPSDQVFDLLRMRSFKAANYRRMYGEVRAANDADLSDQLKSSRADLQFVQRQAAHARNVTETKQRQQQARTDKVNTARARQLSFASALKRRIDSSVAQSIRLARTDKALSIRIAREQAALAARLAAARGGRGPPRPRLIGQLLPRLLAPQPQKRHDTTHSDPTAPSSERYP